VSGAARTANNQFGSFACVAERACAVASLPTPDSQYLKAFYLRDTGTAGDAPAYSIGEVAAAAAARCASNAAPFNPLDDESIASLDAPAKQSDWLSVGDNAESETALGKGWSPLYVKPNEEVAFVRTITTRLSADGSGSPVVTSYYDTQDLQVIYFFRKTLYTRLKQKDFRKKASVRVAGRMKGEVIRLMQVFEDQEMFQAVDQLAKDVIVQRVSSDRHAFEVKIPVNVVPGLHRKKVNIEAGTEYDTFVI
jgi:phage tail sheath gpL-like